MPDNTIQKLTVYRITESTLDSVVIPSYKLVSSDTYLVDEQAYQYRLFFYKSDPHQTGWMPVFLPLNLQLEKKDIPKTIVSGFILIVQIGTSLYGVTGGIGHIHLRKHMSIEHRFGIELAQRILSLPELRGLSQKDTGGIVNLLDRVFRGIYNPHGDINNLKRVLTHVRGTLQKQNPLQAKIGHSIQASDALTVNGRKRFKDIITFLVEVDRLVTLGFNKITIPQLEYIGKKAGGELFKELEIRLIDTLSKYNADEMHTLFLDNEDIGYLPDRVVSYEIHFNRRKYEANTFDGVFEHVRELLSNMSSVRERCEAFRRMNLKVDFDDGACEVRSLSYFLCGDIEHNNDIYFLNNQKWYRASEEFITTITKELDNIKCLNPIEIGLEEWDKSKFPEEKDFNAAHKNMLVMDRHLVKIADERGGIEFCDLLNISTNGILLVHVKHATGAALRALFAQGFVSAKLYSESVEFRDKIYNGQLTSANGSIAAKGKRTLRSLKQHQRHEMSVVFAIFDDTKSHLVADRATATSEVLKGALSTFAKVDLIERVTNMRAMGFDVAVTRIKPYPQNAKVRKKK